jgi:hypothetical protein
MNVYRATVRLGPDDEIRVDDAYSGDQYRLHLGPLTVFCTPAQAEQVRLALGLAQIVRSET